MDPRRTLRPEALTSIPREFCDTNILLYAFDVTAGAKRGIAKALIDRLWLEENGALSVQVLQEFYVNVTRKIGHPLPVGEARDAVAEILAWHVVEPSKADVLSAIDNSTRWQISFWDAMLLTTAAKAGASSLWSEDLNDGQTYDGVTVRNPFVS